MDAQLRVEASVLPTRAKERSTWDSLEGDRVRVAWMGTGPLLGGMRARVGEAARLRWDCEVDRERTEGVRVPRTLSAFPYSQWRTGARRSADPPLRKLRPRAQPMRSERRRRKRKGPME